MRVACSGSEQGLLGERGDSGNGGRYDHTDMRDVNGLIEEYRRFNLELCM